MIKINVCDKRGPVHYREKTRGSILKMLQLRCMAQNGAILSLRKNTLFL